MTARLISPDPLEFEVALIEFTCARAAYDNYRGDDECVEANAIRSRYGEAEEAVLGLTAPDIESVIEKLWIIWSDELEIETPSSLPLMQVIGDLRRLNTILKCGVEPQDL